MTREEAKVVIFDILDKDGKDLNDKLKEEGLIAEYFHVDISNGILYMDSSESRLVGSDLVISNNIQANKLIKRIPA